MPLNPLNSPGALASGTRPLPEHPPASWWARAVAVWRAPRSPQTVVCVLALWMVLTANAALWQRLGQADGFHGSLALLRTGFAWLTLLGTISLLSLTAWPRGMKPLWMAVALLAACVQHFMLSYGVVMDSVMVRNVLQTHRTESMALWSPALLVHLAVVALPPVLWIAQVPLRRAGVWRSLAHSALLWLVAGALLLVSVFAMYRDLAPVVRNNMALRFAFNPLSPLLATADVLLKPLVRRPKPFLSIAGDAHLGASYAQAQRPPLLVLVVGETARSDHLGLNGYARDTTPELARRDVLSWRNVHSCGTSTLESLPCMFSHLGRSGFVRRVADYDNVLDVLDHAGLAVLWLDNQAGCKGVCDRVPHASTEDRQSSPAGQKLCADGECLDTLMLDGLDERLQALPAAQRARGVVLVLHQMGSHGPAYYRRSAADTKAFEPECRTHALADCEQQALVNVYDNSLRETDRFLAQTLDWVRARQDAYDSGFLYLSDHGESLGEMGLYLHGMPYAVAPDAQKHVPLVAWPGRLGERTGIDSGCLRRTLDAPLTHDHLYHTLLGLMDVRSATYQPQRDAFAPCRPRGPEVHAATP